MTLELSDCSNFDDHELAQWIVDGGYVLFIFALMTLFYGLAHTCDHLFVPALEILCEDFKIPPNVAGATFLAIGTSAPDVFVSCIGLFISHSTIGLGTVIGSVIFNHMCICAACVMNSKNGIIILDARVLTRETVAYFITLVLLVIALRGDIENNYTFYPSRWKNCIAIHWMDSFGLILSYGIYVLIIANFPAIEKFLCGEATPREHVAGLEDASAGDCVGNNVNPILFTEHEIENSRFQSPYLPQNRPSRSLREFNDDLPELEMPELSPIQQLVATTLSTLLPSSPIAETARRQRLSTEEDVVDDVESKLDDENPIEKKWVDYSTKKQSDILTDDTTGKLKVVCSVDANRIVGASLPEVGNDDAATSAHQGSQISQKLIILWHMFNAPIRVALEMVIPNPSLDGNRRVFAVTIFVCILVLGLLSELIVECIEILGAMVGASDSLMGLTVSAVGASLPSIWSSVTLTRAGKGDMAISNALGCNTFSILGGLGMPWLAYTLVYHKPYDGIQDDGIVVLIVVLAIVLVVFYVMVYLSDWSLRFWMGPVFLAIYAGVVTLACVMLFESE